MYITINYYFWDDIIALYKRNFIKAKKESKLEVEQKVIPTFNKQLIECSNKVGDKYWEVMVNNEHTDIHWNRFEDAKFCYEHIKDNTKIHYRYEYSQKNPYIELILDKCTLYIIPELEDYNKYVLETYISELDSSKYLFNLNIRKNIYEYTVSLEQLYNNVIAKDDWEAKVLFSTEEEQKIEEEIELTITNNDIKALQKIIKEYSDSVKLSQMIANKLCENMKN